MRHLHKDNVHVTVFDRTDFFTADDLTEHAALDRDTLITATRPARYCKCVFIKPCTNKGWVALHDCY
jgi:hypothetical protein